MLSSRLCRRPSGLATSSGVDVVRPSSTGSAVAVRAATPSHHGRHHHHKEAKVEALPLPAEAQHAQHHSAPSLPGVLHDVPDITWDVTRRSAMVGSVGAGALWWFDVFPATPADRVIEKSSLSMPLDRAEDACVEAAAVCATVHSQMSSTLRQLSAGFLTDDLFQATCERRLSSPFLLESLRALPDAVPVLGNDLAYHPDLSGVRRISAVLGHPIVDPAKREHVEELTLTALQRSRRASRLATAMATMKYTPAGVQLLVQDLRYLHTTLEEMTMERAKLRAQSH